MVRNRRSPQRLIPSPIISRPRKRKRNERPKQPTSSEIAPFPPWWKAATTKTNEFLFNHFGKGLENEQRGSKLYDYWNSYGRSDVTPAIFETVCFICKDTVAPEVQKEAGDERRFNDEFVFCGVQNCPKVYHKECLLSARDRYSFILEDEEVSCPHHHCSQCGAENYASIAHCPTCTYSVCANCAGFQHGVGRSLCAECHQFSIDFNAPEMRKDLVDVWNFYK